MNIRNLKKLSLITAMLSFYLVESAAFGSGYITEIINNTSQDIRLEFDKCGHNNKNNNSCILLYSEDLATKNKVGFVNFNANPVNPLFGKLDLPKKTKSIIKDLEIPTVPASYHNSSSYNLATDYNYSVSFNFKPLTCAMENQPLPFFGLRKRGDLLEVIHHNHGVKRINFNTIFNILDLCYFTGSNRYSFGEYISDGSSYSIEINQRYPIYYNKSGQRYTLPKVTLAIVIKKNATSNALLQENKICPKAFISSFGHSNGGTASVSIKFDCPVTIEFVQKFNSFILSKFNSNIIVASPSNTKSEQLVFTFYTPIVQQDLQNIIDAANKNNL